jgi:hypothetical protein
LALNADISSCSTDIWKNNYADRFYSSDVDMPKQAFWDKTDRKLGSTKD